LQEIHELRRTMTENAKRSEEYPAHDLWSIEKSLTPMSPEEEREAWRTTVKVLDGLCTVADGLLLDPLILALADAITRAREELARVEDRLSRPAGERVHPREGGRLRRLLRRSEALSNAYTSVLDAEWANPAARARTLEVLKELREEAGEQFSLYKQEVGIPE
jgi:hypothetical protein